MVRAWSAAREALEKTSSSTKTAFRESSFCSDSTLAPSSPRFPMAEPHRSPEGAAGGAAKEEEEVDRDADEEAAATATADLSLCAIAAGDLLATYCSPCTFFPLCPSVLPELRREGPGKLWAHRQVGPGCVILAFPLTGGTTSPGDIRANRRVHLTALYYPSPSPCCSAAFAAFLLLNINQVRC
jgi:hypothetical protein